MSVIDLCLGMIGVAFALSLIRVGKGPSLADRAVAADVCLFCLVSALALLSVKNDAEEFVDAILVATLLGFIATVSLALLLERDK